MSAPCTAVRPFRLLACLLVFSAVLFGPPPGFSQGHDKLDPVLKRLLLDPAPPALRPLLRTTGAGPAVEVFIRTTGGARLLDVPGVTVQIARDDILIATVPVSALNDVAAQPEVESVHAAKLWKPNLDVSGPETKATMVRSNENVTGAGVIVGVVDTGIDWRHPDFRLASDTTKTRIKFLWDMSDATGPPPTAFAASGGTEYTEAQINASLAGGGIVKEKDVVGHGTHVTGIAAGNGGGTPFVGMAPEADLIIVKASRTDDLSFLSTDVITAMEYIDAKAAELGKPYVINLSLGGQQGPHDGRAPESQMIDALAGAGKPGKAVVAAAGNDGGRNIHAGGTLISTTEDVSKSFTADAGDNVFIDIWTQVSPNNPRTVFVTVAGPDTAFGPASGFPPDVNQNDNSNGTISITSSPFPAISTGTDIETEVDITIKKTGTWTIKMRGVKGSASGRFDMWIFSGSPRFTASDADGGMLVGAPGTAANAITVGSYATKGSWIDKNGVPRSVLGVVPGNISSFSSPGPTRDGRLKPEIAAPGQVIGSTLSADTTPGSGSSIFGDPVLVLQDTLRAIAQGTSMAAPHVTGAVALALERMVRDSLSLDALEIRDALQTGARVDAATGPVPNNTWGGGKLDVEQFFGKLFTETAVTLAAFTADADGRNVHLAWEVTHVSDHAGFRIFRARAARPSARTLITPELITESGTYFTFTDRPPDPGRYAYWLAEVAVDGTTTFHGPVVVTLTALPRDFRLGPSRPNPFNPSTTIEYDLPEPAQVTLRVYNLLGRRVRTLVDARRPAGFHSVVWDGRDDRGTTVSSGVYLYRIIAGRFARTRKMTLLK